jgi:hypothetical protein
MKNNIKFVKPKIMKKFLLFLFLVILGFECKSQALYPFPSPAYFSDSVQIKGSISFKNRLHFGDSLITKMMQGIIPDTTWVGVQLKTRGGGGGGGSMTWPTGGAGIPYYSGSSTWGSSFTTSNKIPRTYADTLTGGLKSHTAANADSTKLHNEIVKKLNIADTTTKWLYYNGKAVNSAKLQGKDTTLGGIETQTMAAKKVDTLHITPVKTTTYSGNANEFVPCDVTSAGFTVNLPNAPANNSRFGIKLVLPASPTNTLTLACQGSDVFNKTGGSTTLSLTLLNQVINVIYNSAKKIWYVPSTDVPISALMLITDSVSTAKKLLTWTQGNATYIKQVDSLKKVVNQTFTKIVNLSYKEIYYNNYTCSDTATIFPTSTALKGSCAFGVIVADGTHTPSISGITLWPGSDAYDVTNLAQNAFQVKKYSNGIIYIAWKRLN